MFAEQYKKISELYDAHEKSVLNMIEKKTNTNYFTIEETKSNLFWSDDKSFSLFHRKKKQNKMLNERPNNLSQEIRTNSDSIKQLKNNTRNLEKSCKKMESMQLSSTIR